MKKISRTLSTTQLISLGFLSAILIGALLLMLPFSSASGTITPFIDCLFTATTSVCVTGLVVVPTFSHWSLFGKVVILFLIQLGGLGIISFTTGIMMILRKRITLSDRLLLEDALNLDTLTGLVRFLRRVFAGTFIVEGIGAFFYSFVFIPQCYQENPGVLGIIQGIWFSIFHSVSAFCNAGIDLVGETSFLPYAGNPIINFVTMFLIVSGGLGFIVWWDIGYHAKNVLNHKYSIKRGIQRLHIHSKIVLITTGVLIFGGAFLILLLEYNNPGTIGSMPLPQKIMACLFQSVTLRTAGYMTIPQSSLYSTTALICLFLMFIGGSSIGTAGGIKTNTFAVLFLSTWATIKGERHLVIFHRTVPHKTIQKALAVTMVSLLVLLIAIFGLHLIQGTSLLDAAYEATSAIATVGLSRDYTTSLYDAGKLIILTCMYLGRIGPISMAIFFSRKKNVNLVSYPHEDITVG